MHSKCAGIGHCEENVWSYKREREREEKGEETKKRVTEKTP
jgi:hypothetical protein